MRITLISVLLAVLGFLHLSHPSQLKLPPAPTQAAAVAGVVSTPSAPTAPASPRVGTSSAPGPDTPSSDRANQALPIAAAAPSSPVLVLGAATPLSPYITQDELTAQLQIATNNLRNLIYSNTSGGAFSQVAPGQYASGGITNNIALASKIDQLDGITLTNVTVNGISGITAGNLPAIDLTSKVTGTLPIGSGGTGTSTRPSANELPLSDASGNWEYVGTSSLGILGGGGTITSIGPSNQTATGPAVTLATSTTATNGLTSALTITGSGNVISFSPSLTGVLSVPGGGTGSTTLSGLLKGNGTGALQTAIAGADYQAPLSFSYPLSNSSSNVLLAFGTTTANVYSQLQTFSGGFLSSASSTFGNFTGINATTTNATTTSFAIAGIPSGNLLKTTTGGAIIAAQAGVDFATPVQVTGFHDWVVVGSGSSAYLAPTTTLGIIVTASSTIGNGTAGLTINGNSTTTGIAYFAGNVGIGTTSPGSIFSVQSVANWTGATSTYYSTGGINLTAGCFAINGTCVSAGGSSSLTVGTTPISGGTGTDILGIGTGGSAGKLVDTGIAGLADSGQSVYLGAGAGQYGGSSFTDNTALGYGALNGVFATPNPNTAPGGINNVAVGAYALQANTSGYGNTAFGHEALAANTTGIYDGAVGNYALGANTTGTFNYAFGDTALFSNTAGNYNIATGYRALQANTTGNNNIAIGTAALFTNQTGSPNIAIGNSALYFNTASNNTAVGYNALTANTTGTPNNAFGYGSLTSNTTGGYNDAFGFDALAINSTGSSNAAFGSLALLHATGDSNTAVGYSALANVSTGTNNTAIGSGTGLGVTTGSNNTILGANVTGLAAGLSNNIIIADGSGNQRINVNSAGNVGIGTTNPYSLLQVSGPDTASTSLFAVVNSASTTVFAVYDNGNATYSGSIFQSSDQRLKTNLQPLDASSSLSLIAALNPVSYTRIDQTSQGMNLGFIAQQVQTIFPELVSTTSPTALTPDGTLTLNYVGLISPIAAAIQALMHQLTSLEATVAGFADNFVSAHITVVTADIQTANIDTANVKRLCESKSDGTSVCVTGDQLAALLAGSGNQSPTAAQPGPGATPTPPGAASTTPGTPPIIQINGDNPAVIHTGDSYADLGATITGPTADLNLGIKTFLNGKLVSNIILDTSSMATDTIDYAVTDTLGNTATSTRTVIIRAANDNQASSTPANDNTPPSDTASTTAATES